MLNELSVAAAEPVADERDDRQVSIDLIADLAEIYRALGDPTRLRLISLLIDSERCVGELADLLDLSISAVSHQLRALRRLRMVRARRKGRHVHYRLDDEHVEMIFRYGLEHVRHR